MATTNKAIIEAYKAANNIPLTTPLYTWAAWHNMGYRVRKGEKCKHRVQMWRIEQKKNEKGEMVNTGKCFPKIMSLFDETQVTKME